MRMSRVLLAGVAVAGVAASTSAFTTSNTITADNNVAGYINTTVSGATISNIAYTPDPADQTKLNAVVFTTTNDITGASAVLTFKQGTGTATGQANTCAVSGAATITCTVSPGPLLFTNFDGFALTVTSN